jgi:short-subunit dehydrogenase
MKNAFVLGASSGIGRCLAEKLAEEGWKLLICSRNERDLESVSQHLSLKYGSPVNFLVADINNPGDRENITTYLESNFIADCIFLSVGEVYDNDNGLQNEEVTAKLIQTNFSSIALLLSSILKQNDPANEFHIILLSSVAIARARKNNLVYASSKTALDFFCRGLQHLYAQSRTHIRIFRLGYVDTDMSFGKKLLFPARSPEKTARFIIKNLNSGKRIIYYPKFWRIITFIVKMIPWTIYKRLTF